MARMKIRNLRGILLVEKLKNSEKQMESPSRKALENLPARMIGTSAKKQNRSRNLMALRNQANFSPKQRRRRRRRKKVCAR